MPTSTGNRTSIQISADAVALADSNSQVIAYRNPSTLTNNITASGANGRDTTATFAANQFIHFYWVSAGENATLETRSSLAAPPTGPAGTAFWSYVGAVRLGTGQLVRVRIHGGRVYNAVQQSVLSGGTATVATSVSLTSYVPSNAGVIYLQSRLHHAADAQRILSIRFVSGQNYVTQKVEGNGGADAGTDISVFEIPNVSRQISYLIDGSVGIADGANIHVLGYSVPNGDSS